MESHQLMRLHGGAPEPEAWQRRGSARSDAWRPSTPGPTSLKRLDEWSVPTSLHQLMGLHVGTPHHSTRGNEGACILGSHGASEELVQSLASLAAPFGRAAPSAHTASPCPSLRRWRAAAHAGEARGASPRPHPPGAPPLDPSFASVSGKVTVATTITGGRPPDPTPGGLRPHRTPLISESHQRVGARPLRRGRCRRSSGCCSTWGPYPTYGWAFGGWQLMGCACGRQAGRPASALARRRSGC